MNSNESDHPERACLEAFVVGKLELPEVESVERHVAECLPCRQTIQQIQDDTFVGLVRNAGPAEEPVRNSVDPQAETIAPPPAPAAAPATIDAAVSAGKSSGVLDAALADHPRYRVRELIGSGGMGAVYKAEHTLMHRTVALKVISPELVANTSAAERFQREVRAAARLDHPNIVRAHDAEQAGDVHFLVMEFVDGTDLHQLLQKRGPLPVAEACDYIRQAALGLQHAHDNGMVHRDIKPQNLMVENENREPGVGNRVKILDFGLASLTTETVASESAATPDTQETVATAQLTQAGTIMGTPDFMAPEQADDASSADIRADIYSLGCTLYALLSGQSPFPEGTALDKIMAHVKRDPTPIRQLRPDVPVKVCRVLDKMMAKDKSDRYQTPAEAAEALWACTEPVTSAARKRRWPVFAGLTAVAALAAAVVFWLSGGVTLFLPSPHGTVKIVINDPKIKVRFAGKSITFENAGETIRVKPGACVLHVERGDLKFTTPKFTLSRGANPALRVEFLKGQVVVKQGRWELAKRPMAEPTSKLAILGHLKGHKELVCDVRWHPDGKRAVSISQEDGEVRMWDVANGKTLWSANIPTAKHQDLGYLSVAVSPDGQSVAANDKNGFVHLLDAQKGKALKRIGEGPRGFAAADVEFSPDGEWLAVVGRDTNEKTKFWSVKTGKEIKNLMTLCRDVAFTADSKTVLGAGSRFRWQHIKRDKNGKSFYGGESRNHDLEAWSVAVSQDSKMAACGYARGEIHLYRWGIWAKGALGRLIPSTKLNIHGNVDALAFTPDGRHLISGGNDITVWAWEIEKEQGSCKLTRVVKRQGNGSGFKRFALSPDGRSLITIGGENKGDTRLHVWQLPKSVWPKTTAKDAITLVREFKGHTGPIRAVRILSDGKNLVSADADSTLIQWELNGQNRLTKIKTTGTLTDADIARNGELAAIVSPRVGATYIWDIPQEKSVQTIVDGSHYAERVAISGDGTKVLLSGSPGHAVLKDIQSGKELQKFRMREPKISAAALSPNGNLVVVAHQRQALLINAKTGGTVHGYGLVSHRDTSCAAFSADSKMVAFGQNDGAIIVYKVKNFDVVLLVKGENFAGKQTVSHMEFFNGDRFLLAALDSRLLRVWDLQTKQLVAEALAPAGSVREASVSSGGRYVITGGGEKWSAKLNRYVGTADFALRLWQLPKSVWPKAPAKDEITLVRKFKGSVSRINRISFSPDGKRVSAASDRLLHMWNARTGAAEDIFVAKTYYAVYNMVWLRNGVQFITTDSTGKVRLWNQRTRKMKELPAHTGYTVGLALSPDEKLLLSGDRNGLVRISEVATGKEVHKFQGDPCWAAAFAPDGKTVAFGGGNKIQLANARSGKKLRALIHDATPFGLSFSPDGRLLVAGYTNDKVSGKDGVCLWRVADGKLLRSINLPAPVRDVAFIADSRHYVAGCEDKSIRVWNTATGKEVLRANAKSHSTHHLAVSPDGRYLASGSGMYLFKRGNPPAFRPDFKYDNDFDVRLWKLPKRVWPRDEFLLQGRWKPLSLEQNGVRISQKLMRKTQLPEQFIINKNKWGAVERDGEKFESTFTIDEAKTPKWIDVSGSLFGAMPDLHGIYKIEGNTVTVCLVDKKFARPAEFTTKGKRGYMLIVIQRVNPRVVKLE